MHDEKAWVRESIAAGETPDALTGGVIVVVYSTDDPRVPEKRRFIAHLLSTRHDMPPQMPVTFHGSDGEALRKGAAEWWEVEVQKAAKQRGDRDAV